MPIWNQYGDEDVEAIALKLDQTTPQAVINGSPIMEGVQFDITPSTTAVSEGLLRWNSTDRTLDLSMGDSGVVTQQVGQEMFIMGVNKTGSTLTEGSVVKFDGRQGVRPKFALAQGDTEANSHVAGVMTQNTLDNAEGFVTTFGYVRGIKTNYSGSGVWGTTWVEGDMLWVSKTTAGQLTNIEPSAPHHADVIGDVGVIHGTQGSIFVHVSKHKTLEELSDVNGTALTLDGQFPIWDNTNKYFDFDNNFLAWYDGTNGNIKTSQNAPSDLLIQCGTDKTLVLNESAWVDLDFPIIIRTTGANIPTLTTLQGNITAPLWQVNDFNVCEGQELIHKWKEGTPLYWHVHLITGALDASNRYVRFEVEYCWCNVSGVLSAATTIDSGDLLIPANTTAKTMMIMSLGNFTPTGGKIGGHVFARLRRIASTGSAPGSNPWITMLQAHMEVDTIGSRQIGTK